MASHLKREPRHYFAWTNESRHPGLDDATPDGVDFIQPLTPAA